MFLAVNIFATIFLAAYFMNAVIGEIEGKYSLEGSRMKGDAPEYPVNRQWGQSIMYASGFLSTLLSLFWRPFSLIFALLLFHWFRRMVETLLLQKSRKNMDRRYAAYLSAFYSVSMLILTLTDPLIIFSAQIIPGLIVFFSGQFINSSHHLIQFLSGKAGDYSQDKLPNALLFKYCSHPHYGGEVFSWLGIALATGTLQSILFALGMSAYLFAIARNYRQWHLTHIGKIQRFIFFPLF
jgi:steroid 5-alpha reductase family enzyme